MAGFRVSVRFKFRIIVRFKVNVRLRVMFVSVSVRVLTFAGFWGSVSARFRLMFLLGFLIGVIIGFV